MPKKKKKKKKITKSAIETIVGTAMIRETAAFANSI
jgi:hypothetical protein